MRHMALRVSVAFLFILTTAAGTAAQKAPSGPPQSPGTSQPSSIGLGVQSSLEENATGSVVVRVFGPHDTPLRQQAFVTLYKMGSGVPLRTSLTDGPSQASFANLPGLGWYTVQVSAAGYRTQRKDFDFSDLLSFHEVDVTMQPDSDDGSVPYLPPKLSGKAQKHVDKGVKEFQTGDFKAAEKELTAAYNAAPKSSETNYLLGFVYLREKDLAQAETYLTNAVTLDPGDVPALVSLGHLRYQMGDLKGATEVLQKATTLDRKQWEAFWVLSEIAFREHDFEKARVDAESAVELGKGVANGAEFIEGAALAELGQTDDSLKTLRAFLRDAPTDPNAPVARELAARLEMENAPTRSTAAAALTSASSPSALPQAPAPKLQYADWEPVGVDDERLPVADGVTCPADQVIREAGKRVTEFVDSVNRVEAREDVTHEELSTLGHPIATEKRKFDYFISIADPGFGLLTVSEDRDGDLTSGQFLGHVSMFGLADLPLVFHPTLRGDFQMTCEGLGKWQDRATWLVYFRQRPDRPERIRSYQLQDQTSFTAGLKGRAWISADTYQIVRLEANLMKPLPQIGLGSEEDVVEYAPIPFQTKNTVLWLPTSADIYFYYRHRPFHRHHTFTDYKLFSVSATQKIGQPATTPEDKENH
ncbi:MAG TPA: tetratricopeptide repeat protein [Candidatus Acidoferrum sp.]|nr:tetratricopeptide repeat protein [Candidatus Acidoferrum sp.]